MKQNNTTDFTLFIKENSDKNLSFTRVYKALEAHPHKDRLIWQGILFFTAPEFTDHSLWVRLKNNFLSTYLPYTIGRQIEWLRKADGQQVTGIENLNPFLSRFLQMRKDKILAQQSLPKLAGFLKMIFQIPLSKRDLTGKMRYIAKHLK